MKDSVRPVGEAQAQGRACAVAVRISVCGPPPPPHGGCACRVVGGALILDRAGALECGMSQCLAIICTPHMGPSSRVRSSSAVIGLLGRSLPVTGT